MPEMEVNGISINYRLEGEETVVLVNGLADDLESWAFQMDELLAAGYRVLRFISLQEKADDRSGLSGGLRKDGPR